MCKTEEGFMELKQTGLIDRILEALGLDTKLATNKWTPAEATPLTKDEDGEGPQGHLVTAALLECCCICQGTADLTLHTLSIVVQDTCSIPSCHMRKL